MIDYRKLSKSKQEIVDKHIIEEFPISHNVNEHSGFEWSEPEYTLNGVHAGYICANCYNSYYTCLCSHSE